jgi:hypothetical protein
MPPRNEHPPRTTTREHERDARRRYQAAIAAALITLRHAEERFDDSSAAIDAHIHTALAAAVSLRASLVAAFRLERGGTDFVAPTPAPAQEVPA